MFNLAKKDTYTKNEVADGAKKKDVDLQIALTTLNR